MALSAGGDGGRRTLEHLDLTVEPSSRAVVTQITQPSVNNVQRCWVGNGLNSTGHEMKALVATIALLCLSSTAPAHDIYNGLRDVAGHLCCGGQDCGPVKAVVVPDGNYYLPGTGDLFPLRWHHHRLMIASTIAPIIQRHP